MSSVRPDITGGPAPAKRPMTERQVYAIRRPVTSAADMLNPAYRQTVRLGDVRMGSILTVTVLEGEPSWHASISVLRPDSTPTPLAHVGEAARAFIRAELERMLAGVGVEAESRVEEGETALHLVRPLRQGERARVKVPWANAGLN